MSWVILAGGGEKGKMAPTRKAAACPGVGYHGRSSGLFWLKPLNLGMT